VSGKKGEFRTAIRYSEAFKLEVVRELERELRPVEHVRRKYGIGVGSIQGWIAKYGNGSRGKVIRVERPNEIDELKKLRERIKRLESLLADTNLELAPAGAGSWIPMPQRVPSVALSPGARLDGMPGDWDPLRYDMSREPGLEQPGSCRRYPSRRPSRRALRIGIKSDKFKSGLVRACGSLIAGTPTA
jgi:transposase-like protein